MPTIELKYGRREIPFSFDATRFDVLDTSAAQNALTDVEIGERIDQPIAGPRLEDAVSPAGSVLVVVPDATRNVGCGQIVNLVVRRLIANGTEPSAIRIVFATGIHRSVTEVERVDLLTPFIARRIVSFVHDANSAAGLVSFGTIGDDIPLLLNRELSVRDHVILIGGVSFHYFAGFTGGRKLICPGLAGAETIAATHKLAFDPVTRERRGGIGTGLLAGNAVHEAFAEAAAKINPAFCISTIVNEKGEVADLFCGEMTASHPAACEAFAAQNTIEIDSQRRVVIASCGGEPYDVNMIQAHKTLEVASAACADGGTIVLIAECGEGLGRADFMKWFESDGPNALGERLVSEYEVNGQTAWSLWSKTSRFDVRLVSRLPASDAEKMGMVPMQSLQRVMSKIAGSERGFIIPRGGQIRVVQKK